MPVLHKIEQWSENSTNSLISPERTRPTCPHVTPRYLPSNTVDHKTHNAPPPSPLFHGGLSARAEATWLNQPLRQQSKLSTRVTPTAYNCKSYFHAINTSDSTKKFDSTFFLVKLRDCCRALTLPLVLFFFILSNYPIICTRCCWECILVTR